MQRVAPLPPQEQIAAVEEEFTYQTETLQDGWTAWCEHNGWSVEEAEPFLQTFIAGYHVLMVDLEVERTARRRAEQTIKPLMERAAMMQQILQKRSRIIRP